MNIEKFLELTPEIIQERKQELRKTLRTTPGTSYLRTRAKIFDVQPWPFINYLAHYAPELLEEALSKYRNYDGNENSQAVLEGLREQYIIYSLLEDLEREKTTIDVEFKISEK